LNPSDVGIISPYRRQVQKIRELMNKKFNNKIPNYKDVTVGSTEEFQGQVKKWIRVLVLLVARR
jgi:superfamily I DNA and/or RNA helicase